MQEDEKNNTCENCRFFYQHYIKSSQRYTKTCCGHCVHLYGKRLFNKSFFKVCKFWEEQEPKSKKQRENIKETIYRITDCLNAIYSILKDDDETEIT